MGWLILECLSVHSLAIQGQYKTDYNCAVHSAVVVSGYIEIRCKLRTQSHPNHCWLGAITHPSGLAVITHTLDLDLNCFFVFRGNSRDYLVVHCIYCCAKVRAMRVFDCQMKFHILQFLFFNGGCRLLLPNIAKAPRPEFRQCLLCRIYRPWIIYM